MAEAGQDRLREALKLTAVALKEAGVPFALCGGYAAWARGGPEPEHDVDFAVAEGDAARAADALREAGLHVEQPPEDWLFKVFDGDAMVDVIFRVGGQPVRHDLLGRAGDCDVLSVQMPVLEATDLLVTKLAALTEHQCDFAKLLPTARALREQIDWAEARDRTKNNDFAAAFLYLLERLDIIGRPTTR